MKTLHIFFKVNWKFLILACLLAVASFEIMQMRNDLTCIAGKLGTIASHVNSMRSDVGSIQADIGTIQEDVGAIADDIEGIQSDASRHATNRIAVPLHKKGKENKEGLALRIITNKKEPEKRL